MGENDPIGTLQPPKGLSQSDADIRLAIKNRADATAAEPPPLNYRGGNRIHTVAGSPAADLGVVGDYAIDPTNNNLYGPKSNSGWPAGVSLKGDNGGSLIQKAELAAAPAGQSSNVYADIPGLSISVNTGGGKDIVVSLEIAGMTNTLAAGNGTVQIQEDGVGIANMAVMIHPTAGAVTGPYRRTVDRTPSSGVHVYKAVWKSTQAGNTNTVGIWSTIAPVAVLKATYA